MVVATKYDEYGLAREAGLVEVTTPGFRPAYYYAGDRTSALDLPVPGPAGRLLR